MKDINKIYNEDCLTTLSEIDDNTIDLIVTSPPYNIGIDYDSYDDNMKWKDYIDWIKSWMTECYRVLKPDGRICINHYINFQDRQDKVSRFPLMDIRNVQEEIGFNVNKLIIWEDITRKKFTAWGCYDEKTRVMTKDGLKYFKEIDIKTDIFLTYNINSKNIEYQKAFNYIEKDYIGDMYKIKNKNFDLLVTPNHNMLIKNDYHSELELKEIQDIKNDLIIPQRNNGYDNGKDVDYFYLPTTTYGLRTKKIYRDDSIIKIKMDLWLKFLGLFLTDGNVSYNEKTRIYKVSIYQVKKMFLEDIQKVLSEMPFEFKYKESKYEYYTCSKRLSQYLHNFKNKNNRIIPPFIKELSRRQKNIFIDYLFYGDGCWKFGNKRYFATVSKDILNDILPMFSELGYTYSLNVSRSIPHYLNNKLLKPNYDMYRINLKKSHFYYIRKNEISINQYDGKIYCVSVPNQTLLVERNGCFTWCGNSWLSASAPYINTPYEGILISYKEQWKKTSKGTSTISKEDFMVGVGGIWNMGTVRGKTKACFPERLPEMCIRLLTYEGDLVYDPFSGSGTTPFVAKKLNRNFIGSEISEEYCKIANERIK